MFDMFQGEWHFDSAIKEIMQDAKRTINSLNTRGANIEMI